ncbi:FUN14 domain-containing protein 1 isoform X2 [Mesoplodon densirostris]|uniref:FUN14 domain-containing protein 1 isoform X2 n=1 Tax=Mesoplodon densirostris TaxID=48708 RepID=UPI0028DBC7F7|nr:FUN14 domain-containing protein 1 isoform X2 [Mesoplodon densirostris]
MATRNAPPQEYESDDDSYEVLDLTEYARRHHWWNRVFGHSSGPMVEKYSVATQIVMGGVSGWLSLVRSPVIGRSLLGKPRDRREEVCGIFVPESWKTCSNCSRWWLSSPSDCQSQWLCADRLEES